MIRHYSTILLLFLTMLCWAPTVVMGQAEPVKTKVAAAQLSPVFLDKQASLEKALVAIEEAAREGADLIVFPEVFLAGYPTWTNYVLPSDHDQRQTLYAELLRNSVTVPGKETHTLCEMAKQHGINIVMGVHERNGETGGSLHNTIVYISDRGELLGKHRKLIPTSAERLIWARGDGETFGAYDTSIGRLAGLICWENRMPLARAAVYDLGVEILVSPTYDDSDGWVRAMQTHAWEGGMYVISVCAPQHKDWVPDRYAFKTTKREIEADWGQDDYVRQGNSCIVNPMGEIIAGPLKYGEGILYAYIDLTENMRKKLTFDAAGHYSRPDVFQLIKATVPATPKK